MDWTWLGERVIWWVVAFVILFFCAYFIGIALEWLEQDTQPSNNLLQKAYISSDETIVINQPK